MRAAALLLLAATVACAPLRAPETKPAAESAVCHECFWKHQDPAFRQEVARVYERYEPGDRLLAADVRYLLARVRGDAGGVCDAFRAFRKQARREKDPERRLFAHEALAFTAAECGRDAAKYFESAAGSAHAAGHLWKSRVYTEVANGTFEPRFGDAPIRKRLDVPRDATSYVIGESAIRVPAGAKVGVQMERTVRDWLSYHMQYDFTGHGPEEARLLDYHEGARLRELVAAAGVDVLPLSGTLAVRRGDRWFAPDENGTFRFEVLPDKIWYPTTRAHGDLAYLVDTHGISSLVAHAVEREADVVIGCGDFTAKAEAAYHLARRGIDVYFPCDRFVGDLIGHDAPATLIGSAPVRAAEGGSAVIGDRPVTFRVDEVVVVEDTDLRGTLQYYDAPARYFRHLAELTPLKLEFVSIDEAGQSARVIQRARQVGATAVAVRVWTDEDYGPVRDWLAESPAHRAVLFHTAAYPAGYRLFAEFPGQTTFGDPRPRFVVGEGAEVAASEGAPGGAGR